jgi:DNA repair photolyase
MSVTVGTEGIISPLQKSGLNKKGLCDYVVNVASGCLHGCTFCYVPSTPAIRARQVYLQNRGVANPMMDWGKYLFVREDIPEKLEEQLSRMRSWNSTPSGKGVVLLCSGTDPYQNKQTATVTRKAVEILLKFNKRVRILTRSPLWINDLDILVHPDVTVGMSLPYLSDSLSREIEPFAPLPTDRYKALLKGRNAGCRVYIAIAPTPPQIESGEFDHYFEKVLSVQPEVIFWEPINARGTNGKRMVAAGLEFVNSIMDRKQWADGFIRQWREIEAAARKVGYIDRLHVWPDQGLTGYVDASTLEHWWYKPTVEEWEGYESLPKTCSAHTPSINRQLSLDSVLL